ncbi:MAG: response regulator [Candidatus Rokuibacteriota bacterium]
MKTILVVDDRPEARYSTVRILSAAGYDVRETATGRDALRLARLSPALIVLDVVLPDMDGFEVCRRLKSDALTGSIPVLHKTAIYGEERRALGLAAGAADYLPEPIEPEVLLATVDRLLNASRSPT